MVAGTTTAGATTSGRPNPGAEAAVHGRLPSTWRFAHINPRTRGRLAALLPLALVAVVCLARPVTALADHGSGHDRCEVAAATGYEGGSGDDCPEPAAGAAQPAAPPAPTGSAPLPTPPSAAPTAPTALSIPRPATEPPASSGGADLLPSLLGLAAIAGLAALVVSGFRARRRLRRGWDEGSTDPGAV